MFTQEVTLSRSDLVNKNNVCKRIYIIIGKVLTAYDERQVQKPDVGLGETHGELVELWIEKE